MRARAVAVALAVLLGGSAIQGQTTVPLPAPEVLPKGLEGALNSLRRYETIAVGSFPLSLFYVSFAFDLSAWLSNGGDARYAPWPFKSDRAPSLREDEKMLRLESAILISLALAALDALLLPAALERRRNEGGRGDFPLPPPSSSLVPPGETPSDSTGPSAVPGRPVEAVPGSGSLPSAAAGTNGELDIVPSGE